MATISLVNKKWTQALRGQNVKISIDLDSQSSEFSQLVVGQQCINDEGGAVGYIYSVDFYGNSFEVAPVQSNLSMASNSSPGYIAEEVPMVVTI